MVEEPQHHLVWKVDNGDIVAIFLPGPSSLPSFGSGLFWFSPTSLHGDPQASELGPYPPCYPLLR